MSDLFDECPNDVYYPDNEVIEAMKEVGRKIKGKQMGTSNPKSSTIEKLIDVGDDMYSIDIKQGMRLLDSYSLDKYRNKNVKVTINIEVVEVNWIGGEEQ